MKNDKPQHELLGENEELRIRLQEAEETLQAIREGSVDALVVQGPEGERVFTLTGEDTVYRRLVETMSEAGLTVTPEGQILFCNERFCNMLGRPMEDILGHNLNEFVGQSSHKVLSSLLSIATSKSTRKRLVFKAANGTLVPARVSANVLQQSDTVSICLVAMDMTELETSEEIIRQIDEQRVALQKSEERYRALIESAPDAVVVHSKGRFLFANSVALELYGARTLEELQTKTILELTVPEERPIVKQRISIIEQGGKTPLRETKILRLDGKTVSVEATAASIDYEGIPAVQVFLRDITERKQAQEAVKSARNQAINDKNRLEAVMDALPVGVAILDEKGGNIRSNKMFEEIWSGPLPPAYDIKDYARYQAWWPDSGKPVKPEQWASAQAVLEGKTVNNQVFEIRRFDGSHAFVLNSAAPIRDADGHITGCAVAIRDITELRKAEEALAAAHRQTQNIIDNTTAIVYAFDLKGQFVMANATVAKLLNSTPAQMIGKRRHDFMPQADADWHEANDRKVVEAGRALDFEEHSELPGRSITWLTTKFPLRDTEGNIYAVGGFSTDISERKRAEEALRKSEEKFSALYSTMIEGVALHKIVFDKSGKAVDYIITDVNPAYESITGLSRDKVIGKHANDIYGLDPSPFIELYSDVASSGKPESFETYFEPLKKHFAISVFSQGKGKFATVFQDITDRKRAEQELESHRRHLEEMVHERTAALRRSQELLNETQRISKVGGWEFDVITRRVFWTDEVYRIHEVSKDYDPGSLEQDIQFYTPQDQKRLADAFHRTETDGQTYDLELQLLTAKGNLVWVRTMGQAESKDGKIVRLSGSIMDITERKIIDAQLVVKNAEIQNRAHQLSLLASQLFTTEQRERRRLAQVLHDHLQQLLVAAKFELNSMARQPGSKEHQDSITRVTDLIKQSIQESRSLTVELSPPVLHEDGLHAGLEWLARWIEEKHHLKVHLTLDSRTNIQYEQINVLLFQCVRELLFNIVKHSQVKEARVSLEMDEKSISVTVCDEGKGFDVENMWANAAKTTGFGLFSIRERLHIIGGKMTVQSRPGKGSTFVMTLLLPEVEKHPQSPTDGEMSPPSEATGIPPVLREKGKLRILIVDDHAVVRRGLSLLLKQEPDIKIVGEAGNGKEAVTLARDLKPDIILMDYGMPKMNGADATRLIHSELPNIRIIGLSMYEKVDRADAMFKAGASAYISKSESSDKLLSTIRQMYK